MRARLTKDFTFEAAQTLPHAPEGHKCRGMHGHSFKIEVSVEGDVGSKTGWVYDHAEISAAMKPLLEMLDHSYLNDIEGLENPTIEEMAAWFWKKLKSHHINDHLGVTRNPQISRRKFFHARGDIAPRARMGNRAAAFAQ